MNEKFNSLTRRQKGKSTFLEHEHGKFDRTMKMQIYNFK